MPPRNPLAVTNSIFNLTSLLETLPPSTRAGAFTKCSSCLFSTTSALNDNKKRTVRRRVDPYRLAQSRQRKAANLERRAFLQKERKAALGDPVRSTPTPFVESLRPGASVESIKASYLNYFVRPEEMESSVKHSQWLTEPLTKEGEDPQDLAKRTQNHQTSHVNATKALSAIAALDNGNSKDRTRVNFQRCVEEFGRHNTDIYLAPKPASLQALAQRDALSDHEAELQQQLASIPKRAGPDTGSSEVQIAILTTKINVLADNLHNKDKHNKRNLRLLVHKRQKLLNYLRKKERGGPRWQNMVEKLGINDAMWRGEIAL